MLKDCLEIFKQQYEAKGEAYILDDYVLVEGTYLLVAEDGLLKSMLEVSKKDKEIDRTDIIYKQFCELDYLSKLGDMNKALDIKKVIHSNNYLSFFIKKDNLTSGKLTDEVIDKYYEVLSNPMLKYGKDSKSKEVYESVEELYGKPDTDTIEKNKKWINEHIGKILDEFPIKADKNYLKIFFEADKVLYRQESDRYFLPNIYNATEYNVQLGGEIFGMPNDNNGLNSKKPYLRQKTRKNETPYLISTEEVLLQKKFFDFLMNKVSQGKSNIYLGDDIYCLESNESMDKRFSGYFLRIQKGKEVEIKEFDTIASFSNEIEPCRIPKCIEIDYGAIKYESEIKKQVMTELSDVKHVVNHVLFNKWLANSYYREASDIKLNDPTLKQCILQSRDAFFTWFYKGNETLIKPLFPRISMRLIKNSVCNGQQLKAQEQFMVRQGIMNYLNRGGVEVPDMMKEVLDQLNVKINAAEQATIESDKEYAIAAGQLVNFFISLSNASKPKHAMLNPILNIKSDEKLKQELKKLFTKYNHSIERKGRRFNNLYAMVAAYTPEQGTNEDALIYGYLTNSLIYKKGDKDNE